MIEVIKNNARKEVECSNCNSVIAYDPIDIKTKTDRVKKDNSKKSIKTGYIADEYKREYITCPICGDKIIFGETVRENVLFF